MRRPASGTSCTSASVQTEHLLQDVLWFAFWVYTQVVALLFEVFQLDGWDELHAEVVVPGLGAFAKASSSQAGPDGATAA